MRVNNFVFGMTCVLAAMGLLDLATYIGGSEKAIDDRVDVEAFARRLCEPIKPTGPSPVTRTSVSLQALYNVLNEEVRREKAVDRTLQAFGQPSRWCQFLDAMAKRHVYVHSVEAESLRYESCMWFRYSMNGQHNMLALAQLRAVE